jgi:hypothetical protein
VSFTGSAALSLPAFGALAATPILLTRSTGAVDHRERSVATVTRARSRAESWRRWSSRMIRERIFGGCFSKFK